MSPELLDDSKEGDVFMHSRKTAPRIDKSGIYNASLGSAGTVVKITVPTGAISVKLWFEGGSGMVRGRVGFAADQDTTVTAADADTTLGHQQAEAVEYDLPGWAKSIYVASSTATAKLFGSWIFD